MRISKGTYKIITQHGWKTKEGTVGYDFPFYVFREEGETSRTQWCVRQVGSASKGGSPSSLQGSW